MITPRRVLTAAALAIGLLWSGFLATLHLGAHATVLDRLESSLLDLRAVALGSRLPPPDILIVAVDERAANAAKTFPLPRPMVAEVVRSILAGGAKAVALDFLFLDEKSPAVDDPLAQALQAGPTVVAAAIDFARQGADDSSGDCSLPTPAIAAATSVGFVNLSPDQSGVPRHVPMLLSCGGHVLPALVLRAASLALKADPAFEHDGVVIGDRRSALDVGGRLALHYYGPEGTIPTLSAAAFMGRAAAPDQVRGKTVLVGATAPGAGDRFPTPFDSVLPGVEVLATAVANLQSGDTLVRTSFIRRIDAAVTVGLALAAVLLLTMPAVGFGLAGVVVLVVGLLGFGFIGYAHGLWFALAMPLASLLPVTLLTGGARLTLDRWTELKMQRHQVALSAFQSPAILARLGSDPDFLSKPIERDIAVIFIDLTGFTGLTERLGAQVTRDLIGEFHGVVEEAVSRGGGIVATYMADGAMLIWGLTGPAAGDASRAVGSAVALRRETLAWLSRIAPVLGGVPLSVKLGGHFGPAILSRLGHATHQHITAIGDTVNVAARLMDVAAQRSSTMALALPLLERAAAEGFTLDDGCWTDASDAAIRGRESRIQIRLWVDPRPASGKTRSG